MSRRPPSLLVFLFIRSFSLRRPLFTSPPPRSQCRPRSLLLPRDSSHHRQSSRIVLLLCAADLAPPFLPGSCAAAVTGSSWCWSLSLSLSLSRSNCEISWEATRHQAGLINGEVVGLGVTIMNMKRLIR
ncbi:hypothetical protein RIF29_34212 [Crotalaria pallida]|uniref:Uncharacterized protein n=1 Tax=Crotalaria pallida TaxID=3830 RepID=A0AAN9HUJ3_CROPI